MNKYIYIATILLASLYVSCDDANELLNQHLKNGPIVYAGKVNELNIQSGYYRVRINLFPAADINRSYCMLSWNVGNGNKDSLKVEYVTANYDRDLGCYFAIVAVPEIEGNLLIEAQNVDNFGNRSLISNVSAFIYGDTYVSTLQNSAVRFSAGAAEVIFENRVGSVGNLISYEQLNGQFTEEVVAFDRHPLVGAKPGGIVRTKTRYLMGETDIDTLVTATYLETVIP